MGIYSLLSVRLDHLDKIAEEPCFSEILAHIVGSGHYLRQTASSLFTADPGWDFSLSARVQSDRLAVAIIRDTGISNQISSPGKRLTDTHREDLTDVARHVSAMGYDVISEAAGLRFISEGEPAQDLSASRAAAEDRMRRVQDDRGATMATICVMHDGFMSFEKEPDLGLRLRDMVNDHLEATIRHLRGAEGDDNFRARPETSFGCRPNTLRLIGLTPAGSTDLALVGVNGCRIVEATLPLDGFCWRHLSRTDRKFWQAEDARTLTCLLRDYGFSVRRHGRQRTAPANPRSRSRWLTAA